MARITVEDCLEHVDNRFQLVLVDLDKHHLYLLHRLHPHQAKDIRC